MTFIRSIALAAVLAASASTVNAATIIDTGAPTSTSSYPIMQGVQNLAASFTITADTTLTSVTTFLRNSNDTATITASIATDAAGNLPGATLFSTTFLGGATADYYGGSFAANMLSAGTYFLVLSSDSRTSWAGTAPNPATYEAFNDGAGGAWQAAGSTGVPLGLSFKIEGDAAGSAVPEPASWALMVGGFGLLGGAMRRQRKVAVRFA